jgi:hypothetical protein
MYEDRADLHEKVREWIAVEILEVEYTSYEDLQLKKAELERQKAERQKEGPSGAPSLE